MSKELTSEMGTCRLELSRVITFSHEGKPPDHIVFLKMSRRDKAIFPFLKNLSANFNAFLLERSTLGGRARGCLRREMCPG